MYKLPRCSRVGGVAYFIVEEEFWGFQIPFNGVVGVLQGC